MVALISTTMIGFVCGILIVTCGFSDAVTYYPEAGFGGGGLGYGEKLEYGPGVYGVSTQYGYKAPIAPGIASPGIAYAGEGLVGYPKAAGLGYGYGGLKYGGLGGLGGGVGIKPVYEAGLEPYHGVGINKGIAPIYGPVGHIGGLGAIGGGAGGIGYGIGEGGLGYGAGIGHIGHVGHIGGIGLGLGGYHGGEAINQNVYSDDNRNIANQEFVKNHGVRGEEIDHGNQGFTKGNVAFKDIKGDSVHFVDTTGGNLAHHAGEAYNRGQHFGKEGKHGNEQVLREGFKKGHNIKSFKKSHHLDETGKNEEFYDEDHDEGGNVAFDGHSGLYGENGGSTYKGGHQDGKFNSGESKKEGHFDNEYIVDKEQAGHGKYGGNKYAQNQEAFGANKGIGEHGLAGHHQYNNYEKKFPFYYR